MYERQANNKKQGTREKFQDFYLDMVRIFRGMTSPWDEKRKFEMLFRNTREDCRIAMLAANVSDIPKMKEFGKKFDSINWQMYQRRENRYAARGNQIEEISHQQRQPYRGSNQYKDSEQRGRNYNQQQREEHNQNFHDRKREQKNPPRGYDQIKQNERPSAPNAQRAPSPTPGPSGTSALQRIVRAYIPIKRGLCFNCHEEGHGFGNCAKQRNMFCERCGFPGFPTNDCPFCQSKNVQKTAQ